MQLVASGALNAHIPIQRATEMCSLDMDNNNNKYTKIIERRADKIKIKNIIFTLRDTNVSNDQFKDAIKNGTYSAICGGSIIQKFSISLMESLKNLERTDNDIVLKVQDFMSHEFIMIATQYHEVQITIENIDQSIISNVSLVTENTFCDSPERRGLAQHGHEEKITQITSQTIQSDTNGNIQQQRINFSGCSKGYFIESENIDKLSKLQLHLNGQERYNYNKTMINIIGRKVSDNLLYIPFGNRTDFENTEMNSYIGSLNHNRIDDVKMTVTFDNMDTSHSFKLHSQSFNIIRYMSGMMGLVYGFSQSTEPIITTTTTTTTTITTESIYRRLTNVQQCPINMEDIIGDYGKCGTCNNCFNYEPIMQWVNSHHTCPLCRSHWTDNTKFINEDEPNNNQVEPTINLEQSTNGTGEGEERILEQLTNNNNPIQLTNNNNPIQLIG